MSTPSRIGIINEDGTVDAIYCHMNGEEGNVGVLLNNHYQDISKIKGLIALGDISVLGADLAPSPGVHTFQNPQNDVVLAYYRDRGDNADYTPCTYKNNEDCLKAFIATSEQYLYLYDMTQKGWVYTPRPEFTDQFLDKLYSLTKSVRNEAIASAVKKMELNSLYDCLKDMDSSELIEPLVEPKQILRSNIFKHRQQAVESVSEDKELEDFITKTLQEASDSFKLDPAVSKKMTDFVLKKLEAEKLVVKDDNVK